MLESKSVSGLIESMRYNGGHSTKQSSTVTMAVTHKFSTEVATLIEDFQKKGIEPQEGLIRLELIAHYADDREDVYNIDATMETMERPDDAEEGEPGQIVNELTEMVDEALDGVEMGTEPEEGHGE